MNDLTAKEIKVLDNAFKYTRPKVTLGTKIQQIIDILESGVGDKGPTGDKGPVGDKGPTGDQGLQGPVGVYSEITEGTPINAVNASKVLTLTGVVIDGETVTINNPEVAGSDVYEFAADVALTVGEGNIPVNINAATAKATIGLTVDTNPTVGDKMTIGTKIFTFVPNGTANADGEIDVETLLADTQTNIIAAIKGTDHNDPHPLVTCDAAFLADVLAITALVGGVAGNNIATTETFTAGTNVFGGVKLANGSDCSAADAITALVAAFTASDTQGVGAADGQGDTVVLTADVAGVVGNAIVIGENIGNATFAAGATLLSGGIDATVGEARETKMDSSYLYVTVAANTIADKNWRRISLGTAY